MAIEWSLVLSNTNFSTEGEHKLLTPRYGQYLTHAHSHITRAVAAMDSCFVLIRVHVYGGADA